MKTGDAFYVAEVSAFGQDFFASGRTKGECLTALKGEMEKVAEKYGRTLREVSKGEHGYATVEEYLMDYLGVYPFKVRLGEAYMNWIGTGD